MTAAATPAGAASPAARDVLVVGWFPAADDPIAGRFIADQAAALLATGRVRPSVVSFEPFDLHGDRAIRDTVVAAWSECVRLAAREGRAFAPRGAFGPEGVPVARLGTPTGGARGAGRTNQAIHRATVLGAFLDASPTRWPLVHAHAGYPEGAGVAAAARDRGIPVIMTEHATYLDRLFADPDIRASYLDGARSAARVVAVSRFLAERIRREFPELADRIVVVPNTVDVESLRPVGPAERVADELLWVGYRREYKGIPALLAALRIVRGVRPGATLRMIGRSKTEAEEAEWQRLAGELGIAEAVAFEPPSEDRAGIVRAMERAALFVHASRIEMMGIVAVEALAAGLPVVAVDSGGVTEILGPQPEAFGALVPRQDPELLAAAILETLARREQFDPAVLRAHVVDQYGAAAVAARLADLYDEVLGESGVSSPGSPVARERSQPAPDAAPIPDARPAPGAVPAIATGRTLVVGFERPALDAALAALPAWAWRDTAMVTAGGPVASHPDAFRLPDALLPDLERLRTLEGRARGRGIGGLVLAGPRWLSRAWARRRLVNGVLATMTDLVARAAAATGDPRPEVVCLGGIDVMAVAPLRRAGQIVVAPGGPRWLGDRRRPDPGPAPDQAEVASSR